ncbi:MAG: acetylxylan esterase, partial [Candidatus Eremiobacteraeota bacterium]|nr:acetylxylan esterase [Candidatus Eremiobacteraeota bacterium]
MGRSAGAIVCLLLLVACSRIPKQDVRELGGLDYGGVRPLPRFDNLPDWESRAEQLRLRIRVTAGLYPPLPEQPRPARVFDPVEADGFKVSKVVLETGFGLKLTGNLYEPDRQGPLPAVLLAHGHKPTGRFTDDQYFSQTRAAQMLARMGYVVLSWDMVGYSDSAQVPHTDLGPEAARWGVTLMGLQTQNSLAAVDFLLARPQVDPKKLAVVGWSGGGTQALLLAAIEPRIAVSVPCAVVSRNVQDTCACGCAPALRLDTSSAELAALAAPRPMLVVSTSGDFTWETPKHEFPAIRRIYALYGQSDQVENAQVNCDWHNFNLDSRLAVYAFLAKQFGVPSGLDPGQEQAGQLVPEERLRIGPVSEPKLDTILANRRAAIEAWLPEADQQQLRQAYLTALPLEWPGRVRLYRQQDENLLLGRPVRGDLLPCRLKPGQGQPTLVLTPNGMAQAEPLMKDLTGPALCLDPLGRGRRPSPPDLPGENPL